MPAHQLVGHGPQRIGDREVPRFGIDLREKHRLEDKIPQLFGEGGMIVPVDGIEHLVGLLEHERLQRIDGLLAIPRAAVRTAKPGHDLDEAIEFLHLVICSSIRVADWPLRGATQALWSVSALKRKARHRRGRLRAGALRRASPKPQRRRGAKPPDLVKMSELSFTAFVLSLASTAAIHFGDLP